MPDYGHYLRAAQQRLGRNPTSADDIVVMISDLLYDSMPADSEISRHELVNRMLEIVESPIGMQIYENEMARRNPRDVDKWH